jgi:hypothetical protein
MWEADPEADLLSILFELPFIEAKFQNPGGEFCKAAALAITKAARES